MYEQKTEDVVLDVNGNVDVDDNVNNNIVQDKHKNKTCVTECLVYFLLLITFIIVCVCGRTVGEYNYYVANGVSKLLLNQDIADDTLITQGEKSFYDISMINDVWLYYEQILIPVLLNEEDVAIQNILLGGIRIRQLRVISEQCAHHPELFTKCYPKWASKNEDKTSLSNFDTPISWTSCDDNHEQQTWYGLVDTYPGSGFIIDIPKNKTESLEIINTLKENDFIDKQTRVIFTDFNLYNPNLNVHTVGRLSFEFPHTGGIQTYKEIKTWRFERYSDTRGKLVRIFEIILIVIISFNTLLELYNLRQYWKQFEDKKFCEKLKSTSESYFKNKWNILDILNLIFFWITIGLRFYEMNYHKKINLYSTDSFVSLRYEQFLFLLESQLQMVNGFLLWIKMFKYFTFSKRIRFLFAMFERTATDLFIFVIVLFLFILAFATTAFLSFSSDVEDFRSLNSSILNLVRYTVTDMDVQLLTNSSLIIGPIFFVFWSLLMILILANVFIAILSDAYNAINIEQKDEKLNISKTLSKTYKDFITSLKQNISIKSTFSDIDKNNDGQVNAIELQKTTGLKQKDAQNVINMFDTDNDGNLNQQEMNKLKRALTKESNDSMMCEDTNELNEIVNDIIENNSQENNNQEQMIDDIGDVLDELSFISFTDEEDIGLQCTNSNSISRNENL